MSLLAKSTQITIPQEEGFRYPLVGVLTGYPGLSERPAFFVKADEVGDCPEGWSTTKRKLGQDKVQIYYSHTPEFNVVAYRSMWQAEWSTFNGAREVKHTWTQNTMLPRAEQPERPQWGDDVNVSWTRRVQALVATPDKPDRIMLISAKGYSKGMMLSNSKNDPKFPPGLVEQLNGLAKVMGAHHTSTLSPMGTWKVKFEYLLDEDGDPKVTTVGSGDKTSDVYTYHVPVNLKAKPDLIEEAHFVGGDAYSLYGELHAKDGDVRSWVLAKFNNTQPSKPEAPAQEELRQDEGGFYDSGNIADDIAF